MMPPGQHRRPDRYGGRPVAFPVSSGPPFLRPLRSSRGFPIRTSSSSSRLWRRTSIYAYWQSPSLTALSGETASFLAGGEYPIPVIQGGAGGTATAVSIEYKEYGIRLLFRPVVLGDNCIRLFVAPEVSELSDVGAVTLQGFRVPSIVARRAETTLER